MDISGKTVSCVSISASCGNDEQPCSSTGSSRIAADRRGPTKPTQATALSDAGAGSPLLDRPYAMPSARRSQGRISWCSPQPTCEAKYDSAHDEALVQATYAT